MSEHSSVPHPVLACHGLCRSYRQGPQSVSVLNDLALTVYPGERVAVTGASGSGKTTLLNLLGGIDTADSGHIHIDGEDISRLSREQLDGIRNRKLGFVYQFHHLLGEFSALENVAMPLIIARRDREEAMTRASRLLTRVGLSQRMSHKPSALSGGERQRVAIARALANHPACVLMDEPTGNLDRHTAEDIQALMLELNREEGTAFIVVTHDLTLAERMDRRLHLVDGQLSGASLP